MSIETTSNLTPEELKNLMPTTNVSVDDSLDGMSTKTVKRTRRFMLIGAGDGGCNIAEAIHGAIPDTYFIAYNTSTVRMDDRHANVTVVPFGEDGSGKARSYSQDVFRKGSYKELLRVIGDVQASPNYACDYIWVISTADGGTGGGVSPMMAKFLKDNLEVPVLVMGVYPDINEDATAQFNAMQWQTETEKKDLAYLVLDNNCGKPRLQYQNEVNDQAVKIMKILSGQPFGETNLSQIDNKDMNTLLAHFTGRITVHADTVKPAVGMSIGEHLVHAFERWNEPIPANARGYGLFIKAPESVLKNADTSLAEIRRVAGDVPIQYNHLEESDDVVIALICVGCSEPTDRIVQMRERYDDIQKMFVERTSTTNELVSGLTNPLGTDTSTVNKGLRTGEMDLSALDM